MAGVPTDHVPCDLTYPLSSAALDAATEGRGLVLAQHSMVATALAAGTLVRLFDRYLPLPESYFLAWNVSALDKAHGAAFHTWLTSEAKRFDWSAAQGRLAESPKAVSMRAPSGE
jgi:LysR family transcriptional regulator, glycine cleavage system transcriptional activator